MVYGLSLIIDLSLLQQEENQLVLYEQTAAQHIHCYSFNIIGIFFLKTFKSRSQLVVNK